MRGTKKEILSSSSRLTFSSLASSESIITSSDRSALPAWHNPRTRRLSVRTTCSPLPDCNRFETHDERNNDLHQEDSSDRSALPAWRNPRTRRLSVHTTCSPLHDCNGFETNYERHNLHQEHLTRKKTRKKDWNKSKNVLRRKKWEKLWVQSPPPKKIY